MPLYTKYRPQSLEGVFGNDVTKEALIALLGKEKIPQVYLITGPSGCGKTTLARLIKNKLDVSEHDFYEYDAAVYGGVDDIRNIRSNMRLMPLQGDYKFYLFDEAHKITGPAQEALLKSLEDTPSHVFVVLATTEPNKIIKTVRDRCIGITVESLLRNDIIKIVKRIARKEGKKISDAVFNSIANSAGGSARKAINLLEGIIELDSEERMLLALTNTTEEDKEIIDLCRALIDRKVPWGSIAKILKGLQDKDPEGIRRAVLGYCSAVVLSRGPHNNRAYDVMVAFEEPFYDAPRPKLILACCEAFL